MYKYNASKTFRSKGNNGSRLISNISLDSHVHTAMHVLTRDTDNVLLTNVPCNSFDGQLNTATHALTRDTDNVLLTNVTCNSFDGHYTL